MNCLAGAGGRTRETREEALQFDILVSGRTRSCWLFRKWDER